MEVSLPASLGLGKLLRLHGMVSAAVQTEAARDSAKALVHAYTGLRSELLSSLASDDAQELREELLRLFPEMDDPGEFSPILAAESHARLAVAATDARTRLAQLGGWIQGLIDYLTFEERMRLDAEAAAREQARPRTGFN